MKFWNKLMTWYFRRNSLPYWCMLLLDCVILLFSSVLVYWMFHRGYQTLTHFYKLMLTMLVYMAISIVTFRLFRTYSGIVRYSSFVDLKKVAYANILGLAIAFLIHYSMYNAPKSHFVGLTTAELTAIYAITTMLMWGMRILVKTLYDVSMSDKRAKKVLIYGVHDGGVGLAKSINAEHPTRFVLRGFIAHSGNYMHHSLMGHRVYTDSDNIADIVKRDNIEAVLISPLRNKEFRNDSKLQDILLSAGVRIYMSDRVKEWNIDDYANATVNKDEKPVTMQLREVSVEDLLPRDEINVDMESVGEALQGKRVLVTGSAGSIGSEIVRQVAALKPAELMLIDQAETPQHDLQLMMARDWPGVKAETVVTSICHHDRMEKIFNTFRPEYVFHAAAYKHVPMMEDNPSEAVLNNVLGTKVLADLSVKYGVKKFVMVSTDKAVNPTNVMGCSKRICEIYVQSLNVWNDQQAKDAGGKKSKTQFVTTRFGNVLGSNGSVIPLFKEQIRNGGPITVTHPDIIRFFMLIPEACKLVLEAGTKGNGGEIFVFDMGKPVRIADLARRMINLSGAKNVKVEFTGLRPGEKLYEEVLSEQEDTKPSFHDKIRIANVRQYDFKNVVDDINDLVKISREFDNMATVKKMKEIVPEYKSNNSVYSVLDK
ncbi:MAG: polysaccharide biosynthesis protein [Prevotella sp.]|nr:polysaccharide biosynthesis protein [Prevotella sp.]